MYDWWFVHVLNSYLCLVNYKNDEGSIIDCMTTLWFELAKVLSAEYCRLK